ncbi:MAG: hypothetical protein K9N62_02015 [Verrucomicrobia bacterium]|nr:hypothetical protein [Verrucomicrobiota bacterium]
MMKYTGTLQRRIAWVSFRCFAPVAAGGLLIGCASVNPEPFAQYRSAVQEAQTGIDAAMSVNYTWTRSGYIEGFSSDPDSRFTQLMIQPGQGYDWSLPNPPIYLGVKQARSGLAELNQAFAQYADLLGRLASPDLVDTASFDQLARDLNQNATDAANVLGLGSRPEGIALFSAAASEAARLYIDNRRQHHLKRAIEINQTNVEDYSALCVSLLHTIRGNVKAYYADRTEPIKNGWHSTTGKKREKNTEAMLNLNEQYADVMRVLQELEAAYSALPEGHADLARAIEAPKPDVGGLRKLQASAKRLQHLYDELKKTAEKETKPETPQD